MRGRKPLACVAVKNPSARALRLFGVRFSPKRSVEKGKIYTSAKDGNASLNFTFYAVKFGNATQAKLFKPIAKSRTVLATLCGGLARRKFPLDLTLKFSRCGLRSSNLSLNLKLNFTAISNLRLNFKARDSSNLNQQI